MPTRRDVMMCRETFSKKWDADSPAEWLAYFEPHLCAARRPSPPPPLRGAEPRPLPDLFPLENLNTAMAMTLRASHAPGRPSLVRALRAREAPSSSGARLGLGRGGRPTHHGQKDVEHEEGHGHVVEQGGPRVVGP